MNAQSRREFLEVAALALLGVHLGCSNESATTPAAKSSQKALNTTEALTVRGLASHRQHLESAQRSGKAWLKTQKVPPTARQLYDRFMKDVPTQIDQVPSWIRAQPQADTKAERYERILGWRVTQTEAHLFALLAYTH